MIAIRTFQTGIRSASTTIRVKAVNTTQHNLLHAYRLSETTAVQRRKNHPVDARVKSTRRVNTLRRHSYGRTTAAAAATAATNAFQTNGRIGCSTVCREKCRGPCEYQRGSQSSTIAPRGLKVSHHLNPTAKLLGRERAQFTRDGYDGTPTSLTSGSTVAS